MLKVGDRVQRKDGDTFANGEKIATICKIDTSLASNGTRIWLKETGLWTSPKSLEHAHKPRQTEMDRIKTKILDMMEVNDNELIKLHEKIKEIEDKNKKLNYVLVTLEDIND